MSRSNPGRFSQIGTFLVYASGRGRALIDRELYVPVSWTDDRECCRAAGIGDEVPFATKNEHFKWILQRAIDAGVPFAWVTADEAFGQVRHLRAWLEERAVAHVLATKVNDIVTTVHGTGAQVDQLIANLPRQAWKRLSGGPGRTRRTYLRLGQSRRPPNLGPCTPPTGRVPDETSTNPAANRRRRRRGAPG